MYPPDTYEEYMWAAVNGYGCTDCLAQTHVARDCPYNDPENWIRFDIDREIDSTERGTIVEYHTYEECLSSE
jgi:hypothetical protein